MKRIFRHPFVLSLLIILVLVSLNYQGWLKIPQNMFFKLIAPGQKIIYQFSLKANNFVNFLFSINQLNQENTRLKQENAELLGQLALLKEVEQENEFFRQQMDLPIPEASQLILAEVIGRDPSNLGESFLINQGAKQGLKEKAVVITAGNLLVGQVIEVFDSFSRVQSIIDSNSRVNALLQESEATGLIKGGQRLNLLLDLLPQGRTIEKDELVVTSGLAGLFPAGLLIGRIQRTISSDVQISQMAEVRPAVDFNSLHRVFVIKD